MSRLCPGSQPVERASPTQIAMSASVLERMWPDAVGASLARLQRSSEHPIPGAVKASQRAGGSIPLLDCRFASDAVFHHACAMGLEGIVAKRRDRPYRSGRSPDWIKIKNPDAPPATG